MARYLILASSRPFSVVRLADSLGDRRKTAPSGLRHVLVACLIAVVLAGFAPIGQSVMAAPGESGTGNEATFAAGFFEADIDAYWSQIFASGDLGYSTPAVIAMSEAVNSGCGYVTADQYLAFYCSVDVAVYWSVPAYDQAYASAGDAAWVNVMAHEWSHHVQLLIGLNTPWRQANDSVSLELEATCMGGAYVANARERGLVDDDMIASMVSMYGGSDTHGTTEQVRAAFRNGIDSGLAACGVAL